LGLATIFYCLTFETSLFVASYDSQGHGGGLNLSLAYNIAERTAYKTPFIVVLQSYPWERVCLRRCYPVTVAYTCLLRICCLAANDVSLFVSRSLPSNRSTRYSINKIRSLLFYVLN
jgi:hypothetical protein